LFPAMAWVVAHAQMQVKVEGGDRPAVDRAF
jgi:hypothetical protein